jgi:hypothetical protein
MPNPFSHIFDLRSDDALIVKVPYVKVYIPETYVDHQIAEFIGQDINTFGLFYFDTYGENEKTFDEEDPFKKPIRYFMKMPTYVRMCPSNISQDRDENKLFVNVLEFTVGDVFIQTVNVIKDWKIVNKVIELLIKGFIPHELGYDEILTLINDCCEINDMNLGVADTVLEILIAELNRDPDNLNVPFRHALRDKKGVKMRDKKNINIDRLGRLNNTFAAVGSGDPKQGITVSITRERTGQKQKESAVEEALRDM